MTALDIARLIRHFWILILTISLACAALAFGVSLFVIPPKYEATATLTSTDPSGNVTADILMSTVTPLAQQVATEAPEGVAITVQGPKSGATAAELRVLTFSAEGKNADACVAAVNTAAQETAERAEAIFLELEENQSVKREGAREILSDLGGDDPKTEALLEAIIIDREYSHCDFIVDEAVRAEKGGVSPSKLAIIALLGGLALSLVAVIVFDLARRPIKAREDVEANCDLPILSWPAPAGEGEMLWANLSARISSWPFCIAIVPLSSDVSSSEIATALHAAGKAHGIDANVVPEGNVGAFQVDSEEREVLNIIACQPIDCDAASVHCARAADAVVVCIRFWRDGMDQLENVLKELNTAGVRPIGIVLLSEK